MKLAFALLMMTSVLGAGLAVNAAGQGPSPTPGTSPLQHIVPGADLTLIDDDEDQGSGWVWSDSDDDETCGGGDDAVGAGCTDGAGGTAAKAGTAPPPKNGLFTDGTAPVVKSN